MTKNLLLIILFSIMAQTVSHSQTSVNASGNNVCDTEGSISYSVGQVYIVSISDSLGSITEGIHQPLLLAGIDTTNLECYEELTFDSESCKYYIEGEIPEEPVIDCFETNGFNEILCEWILEEKIIESFVSYFGCSGDQYSIIIDETAYNESNTTGTEFFTSINGCDSIVQINLVYEICDPCDGSDNYLGLTVSMTKEGRYFIKETKGKHQQSYIHVKDVVEKIISIQESNNLKRSIKKQTQYSASVLYNKIAKLNLNSSVGL